MKEKILAARNEEGTENQAEYLSQAASALLGVLENYSAGIIGNRAFGWRKTEWN